MTRCKNDPERLQALVIGSLSEKVAEEQRAHTEGCQSCQKLLQELESDVEALRQLEHPLPPDIVRRREVLRALSSLNDPVPKKSLPWHWPALAAAVLVFVGFEVLLRPSPRAVVVLEGTVSRAVDVGRELHVVGPEPVVLQLQDGSTLKASPGTRWTRGDERASEWSLARGTLTLRVRPKRSLPFSVVTEEVRVSVTGTVFDVEREGDGETTSTRVDVQEGSVRLEPKDAPGRLLVAGESWQSNAEKRTVPKPASTGAEAGVEASPATSDAGPLPSASAPPPSQKLERFDPRAIRSTLRSGDVARAREMIEESRTAFGGAVGVRAELAVLSAEADLAERKARSAVNKYLGVVRDYPATRQAEQSLFAAAQLAVNNPGLGYRGEALLRDYLDSYPSGQFAAEARRLLEKVEGVP